MGEMLKARRIVNEELDKLGRTVAELAQRAKGDARKIQIAQRLRRETTVTLKWIARELRVGTWTHARQPAATCERQRRIQPST